MTDFTPHAPHDTGHGADPARRAALGQLAGALAGRLHQTGVKRPGPDPTTAGCTGVFLLVFMLPFLGVGLAIMTQGLSVMLGSPMANGPGGILGGVFFVAFGGLFASVGLGVMIGAVGSILSGRRAGGPMTVSNPAKRAAGYERPTFPAMALKPSRSARGKIRLGRSGMGIVGYAGWLIVLTSIVAGLVAGHSVARVGKGSPQTPLAVIAVIFALVDLAVAYNFMKSLRVSGLTLEIGREPMAPGEKVQVAIHHPGDRDLGYLALRLLAREVCCTGSGSDRVTHKEEVFDRVVAENGHARAGGPDRAALYADVVVPLDAQPSFKAANNELQWEFVIDWRVDPASPVVRAVFPVRIGPAGFRS